MNATAVVNQWNGDGVPYPDLVCWSCGQAATVANIPDQKGALLARLCDKCLHDGLVAIYKAIIEEKSRGPSHNAMLGVWICPMCKQKFTAGLTISTQWRWNGKAWEHYHGYSLGHIEAIKMTDQKGAQNG
jgi:hypothetical protein